MANHVNISYRIDEIKKDLAKLDGEPPYNTPSNPCWHDSYFAISLEIKYSATIAELRRIANG